MSVVHVGIDRLDGEGPGREQLLALFALWRGLESRSSTDAGDAAVAAMTERKRARTVRELHELIAALERRVPQVERVGEVSIAQAAAALKREALKRIQELEREPVAVDACRA